MAQYTAQFERFIGYLRHDEEMGNILRIQMDHHQQIIGCKEHFLPLPSNTYKYEKASRIQLLWDQNTKYGIKLLVKGAWWKKIKHKHNIF